MTTKQRKHIATGIRNVIYKANDAYNTYAADEATEVGTMFSKRGSRYYRGVKVN